MRVVVAIVVVAAVGVVIVLSFSGSFQSRQDPKQELAPLIGKTGRVLVIADVDASSSSAQWMPDVKLEKLVTIAGKDYVEARFVGLEASPANAGKPLVVNLLVDHILQVVIDEKRVYVRDE